MIAAVVGIMATAVFVLWAWALVRIGAVADARIANRCPHPCWCGRACERSWHHPGDHLCDAWWRP